MLVTGASRGLGLETALTLAGHEFRVWAGIRDLHQKDLIQQQADRRGVALEVVQLDVTHPPSIDAAVGAILEESGDLYGLVNNAGITLRGYFEDLSDEDIRGIFGVN